MKKSSAEKNFQLDGDVPGWRQGGCSKLQQLPLVDAEAVDSPMTSVGFTKTAVSKLQAKTGIGAGCDFASTGEHFGDDGDGDGIHNGKKGSIYLPLSRSTVLSSPRASLVSPWHRSPTSCPSYRQQLCWKASADWGLSRGLRGQTPFARHHRPNREGPHWPPQSPYLARRP